MLPRWKAFFAAHKKTGWIMRIFAGYLAGVMLCVGAGVVLIRPVADIPVFAFDPDNSSGIVSEEESSSRQSSELSSGEESSGGQAAVDYKEIEIKTETEVVFKGSETAKKEDALYPGHSTKPGGGNDTGAKPVAPEEPQSSAIGSSSASSDLSSASSDTSTASSNSSADPDSSNEASESSGSSKKAVYGLDVSYYQGNIDWNAVKNSGIEFVFIRVGYRGYGTGKLCLDNKFHEYIKGGESQRSKGRRVLFLTGDYGGRGARGGCVRIAAARGLLA